MDSNTKSFVSIQVNGKNLQYAGYSFGLWIKDDVIHAYIVHPSDWEKIAVIISENNFKLVGNIPLVQHSDELERIIDQCGDIFIDIPKEKSVADS